MLVHHRPRNRFQIQMPLTSLIDIVFLLLIYFLLTTNFMVEEGIKIKLPQARASAPPFLEPWSSLMPGFLTGSGK
jgi:biopolymer transport protein ExbD